MVLVQKWSFFQLYFLSNIGQENFFYDILERKSVFLEKKTKKWHFSKVVNPWFWSKNSHFSNFFFTRYSPEKCLSWYSRTKKSPSRQKKNKFKQSKHWHFSEGVNPWFWSKNSYFSNFFLPNIRQENVYYDIPERKKALLGYKKNKFKKSKKLTFFRTG